MEKNINSLLQDVLKIQKLAKQKVLEGKYQEAKEYLILSKKMLSGFSYLSKNNNRDQSDLLTKMA